MSFTPTTMAKSDKSGSLYTLNLYLKNPGLVDMIEVRLKFKRSQILNLISKNHVFL